MTINEKYLLALCEVSYLIAKNKKLFTIGEEFLLPAAMKMVEIFHGSNMVMKFGKFLWWMTLLPIDYWHTESICNKFDGDVYTDYY